MGRHRRYSDEQLDAALEHLPEGRRFKFRWFYEAAVAVVGGAAAAQGLAGALVRSKRVSIVGRRGRKLLYYKGDVT